MYVRLGGYDAALRENHSLFADYIDIGGAV